MQDPNNSSVKDYTSGAGISAAAKILCKPTRQVALEEAVKLTVGDRNVSYGEPYANMKVLAGMVREYMGNRSMNSFTAADMAAVNILIKLSRISVNPTHRDSWVDAAAYAGIGLECAEAITKDKC
jgi:hypothetical protein